MKLDIVQKENRVGENRRDSKCSFHRMVNYMNNNKVIGLIFRAFSQILHNQEKIMRHYGEENFFLLEDTNELSVKYGELAQEYFKKGDD